MKSTRSRVAVPRLLFSGSLVAVALCASLFVSFTASAQNAAPGQTANTPAADQKSQNVPTISPVPSNDLLESGFRHLYELKFQEARQEFVAYQKLEPGDPMGKAAEAASFLFEQFNQKGVFTSAFFTNDERFLKGVEGTAEENRNQPFELANNQAREAARTILRSNPHDTRAMLVLTMTDGMESDYDALIVKKQLAAVSLTKQAEAEATALLAIDPSANDAYVALGAGHYIIGCLPGYKRAFLWMGGIHGDKELGMHQEEIAAYHAHYFMPFAKILLALANEREHHPERARILLTELTQEYPANPLFAQELALVADRKP
ncbi:MAG: hypothetical protein WAJ92_13400 [Candidatus Acidiferrales bacterium]